MNLNKLKKLSGDASFRHFYRSRNSIIVYCIKNKRSNLLDYVKSKSEFENYDFEASGLNFLVDLLTYNTQYSAYYLNQVASEIWMSAGIGEERFNMAK